MTNGSKDTLVESFSAQQKVVGKIIFITGTDTGVGKTLFTALLLTYLRQKGCNALAMKPFCSGSLADVKKFHSLMGRRWAISTINPFYFAEPVAPYVAARIHHMSIPLQDVLERIECLRKQCEVLLVEGCGGLFVPLGESYSIADLIGALDCSVVIVSRNQLGTINHTVLTVKAVDSLRVRNVQVILMGPGKDSLATRTNPALLRKVLDPHEVTFLPYLGKKACTLRAIRLHAKKLRKTLAGRVKLDNVTAALSGGKRMQHRTE